WGLQHLSRFEDWIHLWSSAVWCHFWICHHQTIIQDYSRVRASWQTLWWTIWAEGELYSPEPHPSRYSRWWPRNSIGQRYSGYVPSRSPLRASPTRRWKTHSSSRKCRFLWRILRRSAAKILYCLSKTDIPDTRGD
ncbi:hypothetical protein H0H93_002654, partial [Arthromyces matolae]